MQIPILNVTKEAIRIIQFTYECNEYVVQE